jgi:phage baseplate assembly protein W
MSTLEKDLFKKITVKNRTSKDDTYQERSYRGFSTVNNSSKNFKLYDFELIKQDIVNHFHIRQGEKLTDPGFGTIIWDILFEPFTEVLKEAIISNVTEIINYDPRVKVNEIKVDAYETGLVVECSLTFLPYSITEELRFRFDQQAGLI